MKTMVVLVIGLSLSGFTLAQQCFRAEAQIMADAQNIRQVASSQTWLVPISSSIYVSTLVQTKQVLYPDAPVKVCLKSIHGELLFRAQSLASDAGSAEWHLVPGSNSNNE